MGERESSEGGPARSRSPSEWQSAGEFTDGAYYVKVNRVKGSRKFSMEIGGIAKEDGRTMRYVPLVFHQNDGVVEMDAALDPMKLAALIKSALDLTQETMTKESQGGGRRR